MWTWPLWGLESTGQLLPKMIWIILWLKVLLCYLMHFNKNGNGKLCNQCHSTASLTNWFPVWLIIRVLIKEWHKLFHPSEISTSVPNRKLHGHESTFVIIIVIVVVDKHQADDHYEGHRQEYTGVEKMFSQTESFIENVLCLCRKMLQPEFCESQDLCLNIHIQVSRVVQNSPPIGKIINYTKLRWTQQQMVIPNSQFKVT